MSNLEHTTSWQQIQQGVKEAERLIVNKNYNLVNGKSKTDIRVHGSLYGGEGLSGGGRSVRYH